MGGGKGNGEKPRRSRRAERKELLSSPATAFCLPETEDSRAINGLLDRLRETGL